jgi:hypothetical protein
LNSTSIHQRALIDTTATQTITTHEPLIRDQRVRQRTNNKIISGALITKDIHEWKLQTTRAEEKDVPQLDTLVTREAAGILLSGPDLVFGHHQSIVLSEDGCFMQPRDPHHCPVCKQHPERITFEDSKNGFFIHLKQKRSRASTQHASKQSMQRHSV